MDTLFFFLRSLSQGKTPADISRIIPDFIHQSVFIPSAMTVIDERRCAVLMILIRSDSGFFGGMDLLVSLADRHEREYAQFGLRLTYSYPENPVKPSVLVRVKNTLNYRPVYQNEAGMHPSKSPPKALISLLFLPLDLAHWTPKNLLECEYECHFFRGS